MVQLTMAILSTGSAECIAVSSLVSYDIYRAYFKPEATGQQILLVSRVGVVVWALVMAVASIVLNQIGIGLGWVYNFMAIALGSAVVPISCSIYTDKLSASFAIASAVLGMVCALIVWISVASTYGPVSVGTLGQLYAQLWGGLTALLSSLLICTVGCVVAPSNFDWAIMDQIKLVAGDGGENSKVLGDDDPEATPEALLAAKNWIFKYGWGYTVFLCIAWPLACIPLGSFGKSTFQLWAAVALMWGWVATLVIVFLPVYENVGTVVKVLKCDTSTSAETTTKSAPTSTSSA